MHGPPNTPSWRDRFEIQPTFVITEVEHGTATVTAEGDSIPLLLAPDCSRRLLFLQDPTLQSKHELRVFLSTGKAMFEACWLNINFLLKINRIKWSLQGYGHQGSYFADTLVARRSRMWGMGCRVPAASMWLLEGTGGSSPHPQRDPGFHHCCANPSSCPETGGKDETLMRSWWKPWRLLTWDPAFSGHCLQPSTMCPFLTSQNEFPGQQEPCKYLDLHKLNLQSPLMLTE